MSFTKWERKDFPDNQSLADDLRKWAEDETSRDLQKAPQQLLCDTIEETLKAQYKSDQKPNIEEANILRCLLGATRRLTSLQTVNSLSSSRTNHLLGWLTVVLVIQTFVLIWMSWKMLPKELPTDKGVESVQAHASDKTAVEKDKPAK